MLDVTLLDFSRADYRQMWIAERAVYNESKAMWEFFNGPSSNAESKWKYDSVGL